VELTASTVRGHRSAENFGPANTYEANDQPHSATWLELDENGRVDAVMDYHRRAKAKLGNLKLHAMTRVVVENQVALGEATPVSAALNRLMHEGLDRHEASCHRQHPQCVPFSTSFRSLMSVATSTQDTVGNWPR
jgi:hypothetical protein